MVSTVLNGAAISGEVEAVGCMEGLKGSSEVDGGGHLCAK